MQNALKNVEEECTHLQMMYQSSQEELEQLVERSEEHIQEIRELNEKFQVRFSVHHQSLSISLPRKYLTCAQKLAAYCVRSETKK